MTGSNCYNSITLPQALNHLDSVINKYQTRVFVTRRADAISYFLNVDSVRVSW